MKSTTAALWLALVLPLTGCSKQADGKLAAGTATVAVPPAIAAGSAVAPSPPPVAPTPHAVVMPTEAELPALLDKLLSLLTNVAAASKAGDCATRGKALDAMYTANADTFAVVQAVARNAALNARMTPLVAARSNETSVILETMFTAKEECAKEPTFMAAMARFEQK